MFYLWLKSLHIISMVCWFAGIFYLPRLFVYHADSHDETSLERFQVMEKRLYYGIMTPSALLTIVFGAALVAINPSYYLHAGWFHLKLFLIFLLLGYHGYCGHTRRQFAERRNTHSSRFFRVLNEFPIITLFGAVILAVIKPF